MVFFMPDPRTFPRYTSTRRFRRRLADFLEARRVALNRSARQDEAIAILSAVVRDPVDCEWAERFLCGTTNMDRMNFRENADRGSAEEAGMMASLIRRWLPRAAG